MATRMEEPTFSTNADVLSDREIKVYFFYSNCNYLNDHHFSYCSLSKSKFGKKNSKIVRILLKKSYLLFSMI